MMKAMGELECNSIEDIVTMDKEEVMRLSYTVKVTKGNKEVEATKDVPMKLKKKLLHVLWWHNHEVLLRASKLVTAEDWLKLIEKYFDIFVDTIAANMARTAIMTDPDGASTVTVKQRNWHINAANDGIKHLMKNSYTVPPDGTEARQLYKNEN
eukprot:2513202-Ditylum_brightwellii.AAC.1